MESNHLSGLIIFCRPDDVRADGGPCAAAHLGQGHGPQAHQPPPPLHPQRPLQQAATHRGDAQARLVVIVAEFQHIKE